MQNKLLHPNQNTVATELGLKATEFDSAKAAVDAIEAKLGSGALAQRSRWFVISVLRHLQKKKWTTLDASGLDESQQKALAEECLAVAGFAASLKTVTKDHRSRFRIVGFAASKNLERGVLANATKAYKIASAVIKEAGLHRQQEQPPAPKTAAKPLAETKPESEKTVVARRAKRRGFAAEDVSVGAAPTQIKTAAKRAAAMSEEEFAELDAALSKPDIEIKQQSWADQTREDRMSRALGVIAGLGFFVFVALLFL